MPDKNFHRRSASFSLKEIAEFSGARLADGADPTYVIDDVAPLNVAGPKDLAFLDNVKYKTQMQATKAGACFIKPDLVELAPKGMRLLISTEPYKAYARAAQRFYPEKPPHKRIAANAIIDKTAKIGNDCVIEEGAIILAGATLGDNCWIEAGAVIGENVILGEGCRIGINANVTHAILGKHVRIYTGARIGQDGFGFAPDASGPIKIPQLGRVVIGDRVEIGANSCVDRGSGPDTIIGEGTWIDNLVQIGHNVKVGKYCIMAAQTGISGSTVIEDYAVLGGQVGVSGHLHIGKAARVAAKSGVTKNIPAGAEYMGYPAMPMRQYLRGVTILNRLIRKEKSS